MNKTIWKYNLKPGYFILNIPKGARLVYVGVQSNLPVLWAIVNPQEELQNVEFRMVPTGEEIPDWYTYVGTAHPVEGWMAFHLFRIV